jgi:hypothetical protein
MNEYVITAFGTPIQIAGTAREANRIASRLRPRGLTVERVYVERDYDLIQREAGAVGLDLDLRDRPSITGLMREFIRLCEQGPMDVQRYTELLNELVFWIPFWAYKDWREMALEHLESKGWEDESIPSYPTVPEILYGQLK